MLRLYGATVAAGCVFLSRRQRQQGTGSKTARLSRELVPYSVSILVSVGFGMRCAFAHCGAVSKSASS
jgi:hypothetical protein